MAELTRHIDRRATFMEHQRREGVAEVIRPGPADAGRVERTVEDPAAPLVNRRSPLLATFVRETWASSGGRADAKRHSATRSVASGASRRTLRRPRVLGALTASVRSRTCDHRSLHASPGRRLRRPARRAGRVPPRDTLPRPYSARADGLPRRAGAAPCGPLALGCRGCGAPRRRAGGCHRAVSCSYAPPPTRPPRRGVGLEPRDHFRIDGSKRHVAEARPAVEVVGPRVGLPGLSAPSGRRGHAATFPRRTG